MPSPEKPLIDKTDENIDWTDGEAVDSSMSECRHLDKSACQNFTVNCTAAICSPCWMRPVWWE
jgi:hypothetical protein